MAPRRTPVLIGDGGTDGGGPEQEEMARAILHLPIDHSVGPTGWRGGHAAARARLDAFLADGLDRYGEERNDPDSGAVERPVARGFTTDTSPRTRSSMPSFGRRAGAPARINAARTTGGGRGGGA